jgi:phosphoribosylaminoimidazole-succinocarboxamide synthase
MTSVKEVLVAEPATADALGRGSFRFTDDYSVFDWGKMPDDIPGKGAALCVMGAASFELLEREGVPTHYRGVVVDGESLPLAAVTEPPREMAIDLTQVPELPHQGREYGYEAFHAEGGDNYLVPLEIVFRNRVPVGSSLRRRVTPEAVGLEYESWPEKPVELPEPVVEFSTKFEESDRYLERAEADRIAGKADLGELEALARRVNELVTEQAERAGMVHEDGKIECLYHDGEVRVADVAGTFDENRFAYEGQQLSKEAIRQYHKREQPEWVAAVEEAKRRAREEGVADWRRLCERNPEPLAPAVLETASDMYRSGANAYAGRQLFEAPSLAAAVDAVREL